MLPTLRWEVSSLGWTSEESHRQEWVLIPLDAKVPLCSSEQGVEGSLENYLPLVGKIPPGPQHSHIPRLLPASSSKPKAGKWTLHALW